MIQTQIEKVKKLNTGSDRPSPPFQRKWEERFTKNIRDYDGDIAAAGDWRYCSVGQKLGFPDPSVVNDDWLAGIIKEHAPGLQKLGTDFNAYVGLGSYSRAAELHVEIQSKFGDEAETVREKIDEKYYGYVPDDYDPAVHGCDCDGCQEVSN